MKSYISNHEYVRQFVGDEEPLSHEEEIALARQRIKAETEACKAIYSTDEGRILFARAIYHLLKQEHVPRIIEKSFPVEDSYLTLYDTICTAQRNFTQHHKEHFIQQLKNDIKLKEKKHKNMQKYVKKQ